MLHHQKVHLLFTLSLVFLLSMVSVVQAAPPLPDGSSMGDSLSLDENGAPIDDGGGNNLGTVMSDREDEVVDDGAPADGTTGDDSPDDGTVADGTDDGTADDGTTGDGTDDGTATDGTTGEVIKQHPVATALADYFEVEYDEIMSLHESGYGFGNIAKAYFFGDQLGLDPQVLLTDAKGSGWGNVLKENGVHPGSVGKGHDKKSDVTEQTDEAGQPQHGGGKPDFAGPSGQGGGNGGGNGNGHGNGNGGGNGNGHGGGNKK